MDIKTEIEIKDEEMELQYDSDQQGFQIMPDSNANFSSPESNKSEELNQKVFIIMGLEELEEEPILDEEQMNISIVKSEDPLMAPIIDADQGEESSKLKCSSRIKSQKSACDQKIKKCPQNLSCKYCKFSSKSKDDLKSHLKTHIIGRFKCSQCNYECKFNSHLKSHLKTHSNIKLLKYSDCDYECKNGDNCVIEKLLKTKFSVLSNKEKEKILKCGRPLPDVHITSQAKSFVRKFNVSQYEKSLWLTGCSKMKKLFCWPCILFNDEIGTWNSEGFNDLNNLHKSIKRHENSTSHLVSSLNLARFGKSPNNQHKLNVEMHNEKVNQNRDVLKRLIDVVCYLGEQELAFRGHDESIDSANRGNYMELINLIKKYDPFLQFHLQQSVFSGISNQILNDLIDCVAKVLLNKIRNEINDSRYVAIILDETTNVKTTSVLSKMVRYVNKSGEICEKFVGFTNVSIDRTALDISQIVFNLVDDFNIGLKLVAQTYNGASVMSSELMGLQKKVREKYPQAMFVHCMTHRLNVVLSQSLTKVNECNQFFAKLKSFSLFFSKSINRVYLLDTELEKRFPKVDPTHWNYNSYLVLSVLKNKVELIHLFQDIVDNSRNYDTESYTCAQASLSNLEDFHFNFFLYIFDNIFSYTNVVFDILQNKIYDISLCLNKINEMVTILQSKKDKFNEFWWQVEVLDLPIRRKDSNTDTKTRYKRLFIEILDLLSSAIEIRFHNLKNIKFLELLDPMKHEVNKKRFPDLVLKSLQDNYGPFFDIHRLKNELLVLYTDDDLKGKPIDELLLYLKNYKFDETLQELTKLCELALAIPATSATIERSFSDLKRIHNYAQNTQGEGRLSSLALISMEKKLLKEIKTNHFYQQVIDLFNQENRGIELTYK